MEKEGKSHDGLEVFSAKARMSYDIRSNCLNGGFRKGEVFDERKKSKDDTSTKGE